MNGPPYLMSESKTNEVLQKTKFLPELEIVPSTPGPKPSALSTKLLLRPTKGKEKLVFTGWCTSAFAPVKRFTFSAPCSLEIVGAKRCTAEGTWLHSFYRRGQIIILVIYGRCYNIMYNIIYNII